MIEKLKQDLSNATDPKLKKAIEAKIKAIENNKEVKK